MLVDVEASCDGDGSRCELCSWVNNVEGSDTVGYESEWSV